MDREKKGEMPQSSARRETIPLLSKKDPADLLTKAINSEKYNSISETSCGDDTSVAGPSRACERSEVGPSAVDEVVPEAETANKRRDTDEDLADFINSYEGMADVVTPAFGCGLFYGIWYYMCYCLSRFMIQFPLHLLLLALPISVGFMGARYRTQCPMNEKLPYAMMVLGGMGTLVLLVRLALLLHKKFSTDELLKKWLQKSTKVLESLFILSFVIELVFAYQKSPSDTPFAPNYCNQTFYNFVCSMNNALITLVVAWIFLYCITRQKCIRRTVPP